MEIGFARLPNVTVAVGFPSVPVHNCARGKADRHSNLPGSEFLPSFGCQQQGFQIYRNCREYDLSENDYPPAYWRFSNLQVHNIIIRTNWQLGSFKCAVPRNIITF